MPITVTRLESCIYLARMSGQYDDQELLATLDQQTDYMRRFNDPIQVVIARLDGKWQYPFHPQSMQKILGYLQNIYRLIFVGWSTPEEIFIRAVGVAFGQKQKFMFCKTLDESILQARHLVKQYKQANEPDQRAASQAETETD